MARRHGFEGHRAQRMAKVAAIGAGTALALLAGAGCQLDPGNFGGYQFYTTPTPNQVSVIWVQDMHGATLEHWAFNNNTYGDTMGIDTVHKTGAGSMTEFKNKACATPVRSYIKVATTEYPLDCASPVKPTIPRTSV